MSTLILVRHGQSLWNAANRFTGWVDVPLSERGRAEATIASTKLRDYRVDVCYTSKLIRAIETAIIIFTECDDICGGKIPIIQHDDQDMDWHGWDKYEGNHEAELPIYTYAFLDERYYGKLQGKNKAETAAIYGEEQVHLWRRSYDEPPPGGESLENTQERVIPCFKQRILPHLTQGDNVLISAHGNSLRAMLMHLDNLTPEQVVELELGTAIPIVYQFNSDGTIQSKQTLSA